MPYYTYSPDQGPDFEVFYSLEETVPDTTQGPDGTVGRRNVAADFRSQKIRTKSLFRSLTPAARREKRWPRGSEAMAFPAELAEVAEKESLRRGVKTEFYRDGPLAGQPKLRSPRHRAEHMKAWRCADYNAGYGDPAPSDAVPSHVDHPWMGDPEIERNVFAVRCVKDAAGNTVSETRDNEQ